MLSNCVCFYFITRCIAFRNEQTYMKKDVSLYKDNRLLSCFQPLPDWFFMYIDLDEGTIQFGSDIEFYGNAFEGVHITDGGTLYPIVTAAMKGAIIGIVYRGQG